MEAPPTRVWVTKDFDGRTTAIFDRKFLIDEEVESLVKRSETKTLETLQQHRSQLEKLAEELIAHETLAVDEVKTLLQL